MHQNETASLFTAFLSLSFPPCITLSVHLSVFPVLPLLHFLTNFGLSLSLSLSLSDPIFSLRFSLSPSLLVSRFLSIYQSSPSFHFFISSLTLVSLSLSLSLS